MADHRPADIKGDVSSLRKKLGIVWILRIQRHKRKLLGTTAVWSLSALRIGHRPNIAGSGTFQHALIARMDRHTGRAALCGAKHVEKRKLVNHVKTLILGQIATTGAIAILLKKPLAHLVIWKMQ